MDRFVRILTVAALVAVLAGSAVAGEKSCDKNFGFKFGGYLKTDLIFDTSRMSPGNYALYVPVYEGDDNSEFFLTARESRFSIDFWWKESCWKTKAYIEFDWQNMGGGENKAGPMLRHAYMIMAKKRFSILAGQYWDIISPLNPKTANYSVLWYQGNVGYRRAQLRFTTHADAGDNAKFKLAAGVFRNITANRWDVAGADQAEPGMVEDGADAGIPAFQGRLGIAAKIGDEGKVGLGVSGHYGKETWGREDREELKSWSFNVDAALAMNKQIALKGEFYVGENMGQYLGAVGQNTNPEGEALPTMGMWGMVSFTPKKKLNFNLGYGMDNPDEDEWTLASTDTETYELKDLNSAFFGNVFYGINKNVTAIFEVSYNKTEYLTRQNGEDDITTDYDDIRFQFALKCAIN